MSEASIKAKAAARRASGKGPQNTSYTTTSGQRVNIVNGVKTYSGGSGSSSTNTTSSPSSQLKALSIALATGSPVPQGVTNNSGQNVGGQVLSRPSDTLAPGVKPYDGPVPYTGTGNAPAPAWATDPTANPTAATAPNSALSQLVPAKTSNADQYFKQLLAAMNPTSAETQTQAEQAAAEQQLRNLQRGQEQTDKNLADQPIAKPFITGQQAAVAQQFGIDRGAVTDRMQTLQQKLANLQAQRQSAIDIAKTGIQYGQNLDAKAQQQYENALAYQQYQDKLAQQAYENNFNAQKYADSQIPKVTTSSAKVPVSSPYVSTPAGGYDSSQGTNYLNIKTADLKQKAKEMFAPAFATSLVTSLTDEQLRFFLNDFTETQNTAQQSIDPVQYLNQWKAAAGIGSSSSSSRSS
jgi:hypothetical protein